jgi:transcriptional regulator of acetoin/glycerol metabolism
MPARKVPKVIGNDEKQHGLPVDICVGMTLAQAEAVLIAATLRHTQGNISAAAAMLKIDRTTLYNKVRRYGLASALKWDRRKPGSQS